MPYSANAYRILISAPGDVPDGDVWAAVTAINRWNVMYGQAMSAVAVPTHWRQNATAEHGVRPQAALNRQLVGPADVVIALFWHRLGTPTGEAESGTVEEIEEAERGSASVAVLRCIREYPPEDLEPDQLAKLEEFIGGIRGNSLILNYDSAATLAQHVDSILAGAIARLRTSAEEAAEQTPLEEVAEAAGADVWPRVERLGKEWRLVLSNTGEEPARDVSFVIEHEEGGDERSLPLERDHRPLDVLAPGGDASYVLLMHMGVVDQARCVVRWDDSRGRQENAASLRFF